jgi:hypothetical protein
MGSSVGGDHRGFRAAGRHAGSGTRYASAAAEARRSCSAPHGAAVVGDRTMRTQSREQNDPELAAHLAAVATTLTEAEESATHRDFAGALAWLNVLEELSEEYEITRDEWRRALAEWHAEQHATESTS